MLNLNQLLATTLALAVSSHGALYTLTPYSPASPLNGLAINAQGRAFYAGLASPSTYCPTVVEPNCPKNPSSSTVFAGLLSLYTMVPGGQQIYVTPQGVVGFTQAHSAFIPTGSYQGGWVNSTSLSAPEKTLVNWQAPDGSSRGILACPAEGTSAGRTATHQIYAKTPAFNRTDCVDLEGLETNTLPDNTPIAVWQYI